MACMLGNLHSRVCPPFIAGRKTQKIQRNVDGVKEGQRVFGNARENCFKAFNKEGRNTSEVGNLPRSVLHAEKTRLSFGLVKSIPPVWRAKEIVKTALPCGTNFRVALQHAVHGNAKRK